MTDYYISSLNGSDSNTGMSADMAWASLSKMDKVDLVAGDRIFLESGSFFNGTLQILDAYGSKDNPIIITSYGEGGVPQITSDKGSAILAARTCNVILENISISETHKAGIEGWSSNNWTVRNVTFEGAGGNNHASFNWRNSHDLIFDENKILDTHGDGLFLNNVDNVLISDNYFSGVNGWEADNIQIIGDNAVISNNVMIIEPEDRTSKGNLVFHGDNLYLNDNYMQGGSFGVSLSSDQVVIEGNVMSGHDTYSWSAGIMVSDKATGDLMEGLVIRDNYFQGAPNGISFYGAIETKLSTDILSVTGLDISGNHFIDWTNKAVKFTNTNAAGTYEDNNYYQSYDPYRSNSYAKSNVLDLVQQNNHYVDPLSLSGPEIKTVSITASASLYAGAPMMQVWLSNELVFSTEVWAQKCEKETATFTFELQDFDISDRLSIKYTNDKYNSITKEDRNLYVHDIKVDGQDVSFWDGGFSGKAYSNKDRSMMIFNGKGSVSFSGEEAHLQNDTPSTINIRDVLDVANYLNFQESSGHAVGLGSVKNQPVGLTSDFSVTLNTLEQIFTEVF